MRRLGVGLCALIAALAFAQECRAVVLYYPGGYCVLRYYYNDEVHPDYYQWDPDTGHLWLLEPGNWWAQYLRIGGGWWDIPEIGTSNMYGSNFRLIVYGRNLTETCYLNNVQTTQNNVELVLQDGGSVQSGVTFLAPNSTMVNSRIEGNMAGTLRLEKIAHGTSWTDLTIEGNLSGLCDVDEITADAILRIYGDVQSTGRVEIAGNLDGRIAVDGDIAGLIDVLGDIGANATVLIAGNITSAGAISVGANHSGSVSLAGELAGSIDIGQSVTTGG
jgi:cytoskeletal protein CcmA (bactofilin family)